MFTPIYVMLTSCYVMLTRRKIRCVTIDIIAFRLIRVVPKFCVSSEIFFVWFMINAMCKDIQVSQKRLPFQISRKLLC